MQNQYGSIGEAGRDRRIGWMNRDALDTRPERPDAVLVYGEPFTPLRAFAFACIWVAIGSYSLDSWRDARA